MIELVFVTCLLLQPAECRERELIFYDVTLMSCTMGAQPVLARWSAENPGWQVNRWTCRMVRSADAEA
ncbi:MAG: hypothetical protein RLO38_02050 [Roseovarius confluentis]|jgi:hypothetical protein